jgi:hypothetical protein
MSFGTTRIPAFVVSVAVNFAAWGQSVSGAIHGRVTESTGATLSAARISITSESTGVLHTLWTDNAGRYEAADLAAGRYHVTASLNGFRDLEREAIVQAGTTTQADFALQVGASSESITVSAATPQMQYETFAVSGTITRAEIDEAPLNGRNFLELAKLQPGALQPARGSNNRMFSPMLASPAGGNNGRGTVVSVDGGSIVQVGNGGSAMGFSQEVIEEFQASTANFDLATNMTASGSVNIVTRSGSNEWHGSGFYFFRDHHLAAYPALTRDPFNLDPFFQRQQFGASTGGFLKKNRVFVFGAIERNDQRGVVSTKLLEPEFSHWSRITSSPVDLADISARSDLIINHANAMFLRYSHEQGSAFTPTAVNGIGQLAYPSAWTRQPAWADQAVLGWTSQPKTNWANDLRLSYFFVSSAERAPTEADCPGCLGIGQPAINVPDLYIGTSTTTSVLGRRFEVNENLAWKRGGHSILLGGDWQTTRGGRTDFANEPVSMTLFSPRDVAAFNATQPSGNSIPLPTAFQTVSDLLMLPLKSFTVGIGDPHVLQANSGHTRVESLLHLYVQDRWHLLSNLTLNYGVAWSFENPLNYDLAKPRYVAPLVNAEDLKETQLNLKNFSPSLGIAWSPGADRRTVVRGGAGIYYDFLTSFGTADEERVSLGPQGTGRVSYSGGGIANPLDTIPGVPRGTFLNFFHPSQFTGSSLLQALPTIRSNLAEYRNVRSTSGYQATNIEVNKQGSFVGRTLPNPSAVQVTAGVQREVWHDFVLTADLVYQHFANFSSSYPAVQDVNHFYAARGPALPVCSPQQRADPQAQCSLGPITETRAFGHGDYRGLLLRGEKRYTGRWQVLASYAYSAASGNAFTFGYNNDAPLANYGPLNSDFRHILAFSGTLRLPWQLRSGISVNYVSKPPVSVILGGLDLNGDGITGDLLPGTRVNRFNRGLGKRQLQQLVNFYNANNAGQRDTHGLLLPLIGLPAKYDLGDPLLTEDLRLSRDIRFRRRSQLTLIGEVFNFCNVANFSGRSNNLLATGFGQPKDRVTQVFGSGGPRAVELGARISF